MQKFYISIIISSLFLLFLNGCSKEPKPYYDRANKAAEKAQNKLSND